MLYEVITIRQVVPDVTELAAELRSGLGTDEVAARASAYVLASSAERTYGLQITGVEPEFESRAEHRPYAAPRGEVTAIS